MDNEIEIKEINPISIEGGVVINGFPSSGITSAIATESMISTSNFETVVDDISSGLDPAASEYIVSSSYANGTLVRS